MSGIQSTATAASGGVNITANTTTTDLAASYSQIYSNLFPVVWGSLTFTCGLVASTANWSFLANDGANSYLYSINGTTSRTICIAKVNQATGAATKLAELPYNALLVVGNAWLVMAGIYNGNLWFIYYGNAVANSANNYHYIASVSCATGAAVYAETAITGLANIAGTGNSGAGGAVPGTKYALTITNYNSNQNYIATVDVSTGATANAAQFVSSILSGISDPSFYSYQGCFAGNVYMSYLNNAGTSSMVAITVSKTTGALSGGSWACAFSPVYWMVPVVKNGTSYVLWPQGAYLYSIGITTVLANISSNSVNVKEFGVFKPGSTSACWRRIAVEGVTTAWSNALVANSAGVPCVANTVLYVDTFDGATTLDCKTQLLSVTGSGKLLEFSYGYASYTSLVASIDGAAYVTVPTSDEYNVTNAVVQRREAKYPVSFSSSLKLFLRMNSATKEPTGSSYGNGGDTSFRAVIGSGV